MSEFSDVRSYPTLPYSAYVINKIITSCADPVLSRGRGRKVLGPVENHAIGFLTCTRRDPLENLKATQPAFCVGLLSQHSVSGHHLPARIRLFFLKMAFRCWANGGRFVDLV